MAIIYIPLKDMVIDPAKKIDITSLPKEEAASLIKNSFGFLSTTVDVSIEGEIAVIKFKEEKEEKIKEASKLYQKGVKEAERGEYSKAIKDFRKVLDVMPQHVDARRNMAMAYLESGDVEKAKEHLQECLQLDPNNSWTNLLLGNIYARHERNLDAAEFFFQKCHEINPNDNIMLNNYAALLMEKGNLNKAKELFEKALTLDPSYPNTYYGLAVLLQALKEPEIALQTLEKLFSQPKSKDMRSAQVYKQAQKLYTELNKEIAENSFDHLMETILHRKRVIEEEGGFPIQVMEDNSLEYVSAVAQMAWKHHRGEHIVKYRKKMTSVTPHLIAHELEHIVLEQEARKAGRNRHFTTTPSTREHAVRSVSNHVTKLKEWGYSDDGITEMILRTTHGICNQLFNCPLEMFIEYRIFENLKELHPSQFISLCNLQEEALSILTNKEIRRLTPPRIYSANITLNCAYAFFADHLFQGKTEYSLHYRASDVFQTGKQLFDLYLKKIKTFTPGDEYDLVDEYARILKLQKWYEWKSDIAETVAPPAVTNPELLKANESDTFKYCLEALRRFEDMPKDEIFKIVSEIGLLGKGGIDYSTPKTYTLKSIPREQFTGLQLLCMMYVGFQKIEPTMYTGLDFKEAYTLALDAYKARVH